MYLIGLYVLFLLEICLKKWGCVIYLGSRPLKVNIHIQQQMAQNSEPPGSEDDVLWEKPVYPEHGIDDSDSELQLGPHISVRPRE